MRLLILFVRSRGGALLIPVVPLVVLWCATTHLDVQPNPLDITSGSLFIALTGLGIGVFVTMCFGTAMGQLEHTLAPARLRMFRLAWLALIIVVFGLAGSAGLWLRGASWWYAVMHWRNTVQGVTLGCLSACFLPRPAAWIVPACGVALCWLMGLKDIIGTPRLLAFPCYDPRSVLSWIVTAGVCLAAATIYVWRDAWQEG